MKKFKIDTELIALWLMILLIFVLVSICMVMGAFIFMSLWNWIMPYLFGLPKLSYLMALGFLWLLSFLTAGFRIVVRTRG